MAFDLRDFNQEVGFRLRIHRERKGKTQGEIAKAIGVPRATYANVEGGRQRISLDLVWKAAVVFDVQVDALMPEPKRYRGTASIFGPGELRGGTSHFVLVPPGEPEKP